MNYYLDKNGWTIIIDDFDFKTATQEDINYIAQLIASNCVVVVKNCFLTVEEELRAIKLFKNPKPIWALDSDEVAHCTIPNSENLIFRVTGELNEHGRTGLSAHPEEAIWHCDWMMFPQECPIIWMRGIRGTAGSETWWNNGIIAYNDLDQKNKDLLETLTIFIMVDRAHTMEELDTGVLLETYTFKAIHKNIDGRNSLFFPFYQISHFEGMSKEDSKVIVDSLADYVVQDKYCYKHKWEDGDLVLCNSWTTLHKRNEFHNMQSRLLHRAVFDFPDQKYTKD